MPDIASIIEKGAQNPWLFLPAALLLGALHALEPGHSKSMMAAFIIAVRGTPAQAAVLGLSAAIGHTIVIWALAVAGLWLGDKLILDKAEPWLMVATGLLVVALAVRIFYLLGGGGHAHDHGGHHHDEHDHDHGGHAHTHDHEEHARHSHAHEHHGHGHGHDHGNAPASSTVASTAPASAPAKPHDAHAAAHAADIERRLAGRTVTTWDIAWFGFSAGLLPCPAAFAVLVVCLQLKRAALGLAMVAAFSAGLAITLVGIGIAAAWAARKASESGSGGWLERWGHVLPYASASIVLAVGLFVLGRGLIGLHVI